MKKLITLSSIFLIASILFTSCRSNMSVTKRHYNDGYYITNTKAKQSNNVLVQEEKVAQTEKKTLKTSPLIVSENATKGYFQERPVTTNGNTIASTEKGRGKAISKKDAMNRSGLIAIESPTKQIRNLVSQTKNIRTYTAEGDGLSLFWIIILVLLILWAIGFISSGFLIGSVINLLLLVALILLILWLLRIL